MEGLLLSGQLCSFYSMKTLRPAFNCLTPLSDNSLGSSGHRLELGWWRSVCPGHCLSLLLIPVINTVTKRQLGGEKICLAYMSKPQSIMEGSQDRSSGKRRGLNLEEICSLSWAFSACFRTQPRTTSPEMALPTVGFAFPHQLLIKEISR